MPDYTYRIYTGAPNVAPNFSNFFNAIADFRTNNRMGAGVAVGAADSTLFFLFDGMVAIADAEIYDINASASGFKIVVGPWSNRWNASASTALADTSAFDGVVIGDATWGVFAAQGGNIEFRNLVVRKIAGTAGTLKATQFAGTGTILIDGLLLANDGATPLGIQATGGTTIRNTFLYLSNAAQTGTPYALSCGEGSPTVEHLTVISKSAIGAMVNPGGTVPVVKNSYVGGMSATPWAGVTWAGTSVGNASSGTGTPNGGLTGVAVDTTNFESVTGVGDYRVKAASVLKTTGAARLASTLTDAFGQSRSATTTSGAHAAEAVAATVLSGGATLDGPTAAGGLSSLPPSTLSGGATLDGPNAAGTLGVAPGTLTSSWLQLNNGFAHTSAPFEALVSNVVTGALIVRKTGLTSSASATVPVCTFNDAALPAPGTQVRVTWRRTDTGAEGTELLIVT